MIPKCYLMTETPTQRYVTNLEALLLDDWGIIIQAVHLKNCLTLKELN